MQELRSYLADQWISGAPDGAVTLVNPATEAPVASASTRGLDLGAALRHAREVGGPALRAMTFAERGALIGRMSEVIQAQREALIESSIVNAGTTRGDSKFDIDGASGTLWVYAQLGKSLGDVQYLHDGDFVQFGRSPRFGGQHLWTPRAGAALLINAFNFPAWGFAEKAACALLAGMPVLCKPSTPTAAPAYEMIKALVEQAELPPGAVSLLCGEPEDLMDHLGAQDVVAFTGSSRTGQLMRRLPAVIEQGVRLNVEADSLNAAVLGPDAEPGSETFGLFVRDLVRDITQKTGQKCTAIRRALVPEALAGEISEAVVDELSRIKIGDPAQSESRMGPLATAQQHRSVQEGVAALEADAQRLCGSPGRPEGLDKGYFVSPMLLRVEAGADAPVIHAREVFGPVSTLVPYRDAGEAAALVARGQGGLVTSVYSDDTDFLKKTVLQLAPWHGRVYVANEKVAAHATGPGTVMPNTVHGGPGRAGGGEELGGERGMHFYMQRTAVQGPRGFLTRAIDGSGLGD